MPKREGRELEDWEIEWEQTLDELAETVFRLRYARARLAKGDDETAIALEILKQEGRRRGPKRARNKPDEGETG